MTTNTIRCIETTLVSGMMVSNAILPMPTWLVVIVLLCLLWVWLPDFEIHI